MLAPIFGGWLLTWFSWPSIFFTQAAVGGVALAGVWKMKEPFSNPSRETVWRQLKNYFLLFENSRFLVLAAITSISMLPLFAFVAGSSDIYINRLGLNEQIFGFFFGANALAYISGSFACSRLVRRVPSRLLMTIGFTGILTGGILLLFSVRHSPWGLALPMFMISHSIGLCRPPGTNLALEQVERNAGAASSFLVFTLFVFGAMAMWLISLDWSDKMDTLGWLGVSCGVLSLGGWLALQRVLKPRFW
jgi:DHA1 family bicyclomycin/chloramphenicol resistance-like MFS transporter